MRRILALTLIALTSLSTGVASASSGSLTSYEYEQLVSLQERTKALNGTGLKAVRAALWACEQIQMQTPLLTEERAACDALAQIGVGSLSLKQAVPACISHNPSVGTRLACLVSLYGRIYTASSSLYSSEQRLNAIVRARGFGARCAAFLGVPPRAIAATRALTSEFGLLVGDLRSGRLADFQALSKIAGRDMTALFHDMHAGPTQPSDCPHQ